MSNTPQKIFFRYDGSDEAKEAFNLLNKATNGNYLGYIDLYYYKSKDSFACCCFDEIPDDYTLVPPSEFIRLMKGEEWRPKYGEEVEASDDGDKWHIRKFLCYTTKGKPVVENKIMDAAVSCEYIRPIRKSLREEIVSMLWGSFDAGKKADEIIQLLKERGVEG